MGGHSFPPNESEIMAKTLKAPAGIDQASVGGNLYMVDPSDQLVDVKDEDVSALIADAGFTDPAAVVDIPAGFVRLRAPDGAESFSSGGIVYTVGDDGSAIVSITAAADLIPHGFVALGAAEAPEPVAPVVEPEPVAIPSVVDPVIEPVAPAAP
jgi:hypothetical protein